MKRLSPEAKVGLLVIGAIVLLAYMSMKVGSFGPSGDRGYTLHLLLESAAGLTPDGEVLVAGITVGSIEDIRLHEQKALLTLRIQNRVKLPKDSTAGVKTHGVLGEKYVEIIPGKSTELLRDGDWLQGAGPTGDLDRLVGSLNEIAVNVKSVTEHLANVFGNQQGEQSLRDTLEGFRGMSTGMRDIVAENRVAVRETIQNLREMANSIRTLVEANRENVGQGLASVRKLADSMADRAPRVADKVEKLTGDLDGVIAENRQNLREAIANFKGASAHLSTTLESTRSLMDSARSPKGTLGRLMADDALYEDLRTVMADLHGVLGRIEKGEGTLGKLVSDDSLYADLLGSAESLRNVTEKIDKGQGTLGKLINDSSLHDNLNSALEGINEVVTAANRFQFELGWHGEFMTSLGEGKNYFDLEIRPRQDRFYYIALVDDPLGFEETTKTVRTVDGKKHKEKEVETTDRLKFSLQAGKRFSFLTLRGGIFESSGGVGADVNLLSDRLRLTSEIFDFSREDRPPHLKLSARWSFWNHLYVTAGWDDVLDSGRRDVFVGAGFRFVDDDLKYLLSPAAGLAK